MAIADNLCKNTDNAIGCSALGSHKLKEHDAIRKLSAALGERLLGMYDHGAIKGGTLVFFFRHPAALGEFGQNREQIRARMAEIWKKEGLKDILTFSQFRAEVRHKAPQKEADAIQHQDKASGDFEIKCRDPQLRIKFEQIQKNIKEGHNGTNSS